MKAGAEQLRKLCRDILGARRVKADDASLVGDVLVEANLCGHDSHGVVRVPQWVKGLDAGAINAGCAPKVMLPGEPEDACRKRRLAEGIAIDDDLFGELEDLAAGAA